MQRVVDFRLGSLTGEGGFDSVSGSGVAITETDTGVGVYAADWTSDASNYGVIEFDGVDEVFVYVYLILDTAPAGDQTVLQILNDGTVVGEIDINASCQLELKNNGTQKGSASSALTLGTLYRVGLRQKVGTGADGELQGYVAERHKDLVSFASATTESFTTQADEIRAGACDAVAFDGRIGYLAASDRGFPPSWLDLHDVVVGPLGFMGMQGPRTHSVGDMAPAYDRAALGERQHDTFQTMSFVAQANMAGGVGQARLVSADRILTGIADTRFPGYVFPPRAAQAVSNGGATAWYFNRGATLYGVTDTNFEAIGTGTQTAHGGMPAHQPVVDGKNNVYWATTGRGLRKWDGTTVQSVRPAFVDRVYHVAQYGTHIWAFCEADIPTIGVAGNSGSGVTGGTSRTWSQAAPSEDPYTLTLFALTIESGTASAAESMTIDPASSVNWELLGEVATGDGASLYLRTVIYYRFGGGAKSGSIRTVKSVHNDNWTGRFINVRGVDPEAELRFHTATAEGTGTSIQIIGEDGADYQVSGVVSSANGDNAVPGTGWTSISRLGAALTHSVEYAVRSGSDATPTWSNLSSGAYKLAWNVNLSQVDGAGQTQFRIIASDDGGETWQAAPANFTTNLFGTIRASVATAGALWIVTDRGLFRMVGQVNQTLGGTEIVDIGITQHDKWEVPADDNAGKWIGSFQGLLYYPVGATIRRYAPNSSDPNDERAIWPPADWATKADKVQALVANEGGIWFGAAGYLWNFNGRGFHQMAAEPEAGAFDYLFWHQGRLYYKDSPAGYYNYGYVTVRPDILIANGDLDQDDFTTGYVITSSLDFEKVADAKVIRLAESNVSFTAQDADSGSVALHYRNGCGTDADPGVGSGGDTGSTWTLWGTHGYADGGYKRHVLATPLQCYRLYARATLTPGATGIPVLHFFTLWGQGVMPPVQKIVAQIKAEVGQTNRAGGLLWGNAEEVKKALRVLKAWRRRVTPGETLYHWVTINDGTDGGDEFLCTFTQLEYTLTEQSNDLNRCAWEAAISFEEIPS